MKVKLLLAYTFLHLLFSNTIWSQCPSGAIGVTGSGCGCAAGCNLTSLGGPNCSGTTGNCSLGQLSMSQDITVPAGCTITVTSTMSVRGGACTASGADGGDQMKVDVVGGSKPFQTGASNATINDSYTLVGPGTIRVSGTANRADEIITYSASSVGCVNCSVGLPVELTVFQANQENNMIACFWQTESERDNDFFTVERSSDAITYEIVGYMDGAGNSYSPLTYKLYDSSPSTGLNYYRLRQTDFNGTEKLSEVVSVLYYPEEWGAVYNKETQSLLFSKELEDATTVRIYDAAGRLLLSETTTGTTTLPLHVENGLLYIHLTSENGTEQFIRVPVM